MSMYNLCLLHGHINPISYIVCNTNINMTTIRNEIEINAPIASVFEYYTNPDNIGIMASEIVKESENVSVKKRRRFRNEVTGNIWEKEMISVGSCSQGTNKKLLQDKHKVIQRWESVKNSKMDKKDTRVFILLNRITNYRKDGNFLTGVKRDKINKGFNKRSNSKQN